MAARNASFREGVIARVVFGPIRLVALLALMLAAMLLLAWALEWIFVFGVWPEGIDRLRSVLAADLERGVALAAQQGVPGAVVTGTANFLYEVVFRATGIHDMGMRFADAGALSIPDTIVRNAYVANRDAIEVAMIATQLLGVRLATLCLALPGLMLALCAGVADGLVQRAIRRACGGAESSSLYHRAKLLQVALLALAASTTLLLPWSMDPRWLGWPCAILLGLVARVQWTYYKKHL